MLDVRLSVAEWHGFGVKGVTKRVIFKQLKYIYIHTHTPSQALFQGRPLVATAMRLHG
jgi:hypothetical protein